MNRISELRGFLTEQRGDPKFIRHMIEVNEDILTLLTHGKEVRFYKVLEIDEIKPSKKKVFFCPSKKFDDPSCP